MPIRMGRHDETLKGTQVVEDSWPGDPLPCDPTARNVDRNTEVGMTWGAVQSFSGRQHSRRRFRKCSILASKGHRCPICT